MTAASGMMPPGRLPGVWRQVRQEVHRRWERLTDEDLDRIDGSREQLVGKLEDRYGWSRVRAEIAVAAFEELLAESGGIARGET